MTVPAPRRLSATSPIALFAALLAAAALFVALQLLAPARAAAWNTAVDDCGDNTHISQCIKDGSQVGGGIANGAVSGGSGWAGKVGSGGGDSYGGGDYWSDDPNGYFDDIGNIDVVDLSGRRLVVRVRNGKVVESSVSDLRCPPDSFVSDPVSASGPVTPAPSSGPDCSIFCSAYPGICGEYGTAQDFEKGNASWQDLVNATAARAGQDIEQYCRWIPEDCESPDPKPTAPKSGKRKATNKRHGARKGQH